MTSNAGGLASNTLHQASITGKHISEVLDDFEVGLVESSGKMGLSDGESNSVGETLTERASRDFNAVGVVVFGVARGLGVDLTERFEVVEGKLVSEQVEEDVLERATAQYDFVIIQEVFER